MFNGCICYALQMHILHFYFVGQNDLISVFTIIDYWAVAHIYCAVPVVETVISDLDGLRWRLQG